MTQLHKSFSLSDTSDCEIIQLSAICGDVIFDAYTMPSGNVADGATRKTGLSVREGRLYLWGTPVQTVPLHQVFTSFLAYIRSVQGPVLLAAHNAKLFDMVILTRVLQQQFPDLWPQFKRMVPACLDTLPLSKRVHPGLKSYSLSSLVDKVLGEAFRAHNAVEDARVLQKLFSTWNPARSTYSEFITQV